jgi:septal ring factor EnvC (AmiA/AmiB activator)
VKRLKLLAGIVLLAAFAAQPAHAADPKAKLHKIETQLDQGKQRAAALDQKAQDTADNLKDLHEKLIAATEAVEAKEAEENQIQDKLDDLARDIAMRQAALAGEKKKLKALTAALIELARRPPETLLLQTGLSDDYIRRRILLRAVLPRIQEKAVAIAQDVAALSDMKTQMEEQERLMEAARHNLEQQEQALDQLIKARQGLLQRTETQKEAIAKQLVSLSDQAKDLRQLLDKIAPKHKGHSTPSHPLAIKWPVEGAVTRRFGERDKDGVLSQGVTFLALPGGPVVAPAAGRVVFSGPFRGYGQILILQHEGGYHSFLAGFGRIDADMGQEVDAGEPLGVLPSGRGSHPELYFEWRHDNDPIDPVKAPALPKARN